MIAHVEKGCVPRSTSAAGATSELAAAAAPKPATTTTSAAAAATASASAPVAAVASTPAAAAARASTGTVRATEPQLESRMYSQAVALRAQRMNKALQRLRDASDEVTPRDLMFLKHIIKERLSAPATASLLSDEHQVCPRSRGNLALCAYRLTCTCCRSLQRIVSSKKPEQCSSEWRSWLATSVLIGDLVLNYFYSTMQSFSSTVFMQLCRE